MLNRFTRRLHQRFGINSSKTSPWLLVGLVLGGVAGSYLALEWQLGEQVLEVLNPSLSPVHRGPPLSRLLGFLAGAGVLFFGWIIGKISGSNRRRSLL